MKRIALIVTSTAVFAASCGAATAAVRLEVTMPTQHAFYIIEPYPAQLANRSHRLAPNTGYRLLNPVSVGKRATTQTPSSANASRGVVDPVNLPS